MSVDLIEPGAQLSTMTERELLRGYGAMLAPVVVSRPCACGTFVRTWSDDPADDMRVHQASRSHRAWRSRLGL